MVRLGKLPKPQKLTERCSVWRESVITKAVNDLLGSN
jgi:predicted DNA-binding transcriptional regulator AlpA